MKLELRPLQSFLVLCEELNFTRASARLMIAQSALSQQIKTLESSLQTDLIDRSNPKRIGLTPAGLALKERAAHIIDDAREAESAVLRTARGELGHLRIGFMGTATSAFLHEIVSEFKQSHPGILVSLLDKSPAIQRQMLLAQEMEVGFCRDIKPDEEGQLESLLLYKDRLKIAVPETWDVEDPVDLKALKGKACIAYSPQQAPWLYQVTAAAFSSANTLRTEGPVAENMATLLLSVASGLGFALVPGCVKSIGQPGIHLLDIDLEPITLPVYATWHSQTNHQPTLQMRKLLADHQPRIERLMQI